MSVVPQAKAMVAELALLDLTDSDEQYEAVQKAKAIVHLLENPGSKALELTFTFLIEGCLVAASDLKLFHHLSKGPTTTSGLAKQCGANELLITRLMRTLAAIGVISQLKVDTFAPTTVSNIFATAEWESGLKMITAAMEQMTQFPQYLKSINYSDPSTATPSAFQFCFNTKDQVFDWLSKNPDTGKNFNTFMGGVRTNPHWTESFLMSDGIFDDSVLKQTTPLVVDIAGGFGHDLRALKTKLALPFQSSKDRFVLQDLEGVLSSIPEEQREDDIVYTPCDFLKPTIVPGSRLYCIKSTLHNWPDEKAVLILRNIASAMIRGYSQLWVIDGVVPDVKVTAGEALMDIAMMIMLGAQERTRAQWESLMQQAGLKITTVRVRPDGVGCLEAELV